MIIHKRLQNYLDSQKIPYQIVNHSVAYTAQEAAESLHVPGNLFAKVVHLFPDCEIGSMPPFGNLYGMSVYVDGLLTNDEVIFFDAGTHVGAIKLRYRDFADLVHPQVAEFHREPTKLEY